MAGTPVMIVAHSNELMEWANALSTVRQNGLIGQLAQLFSRSNPKLAQAIQEIIVRVGATGPQDMGKVMGMASKELAGKADGKAIADRVKTLLAK